jgi:arylsulfatase A-like enzyme/Tfp pilus assembly protein PilF
MRRYALLTVALLIVAAVITAWWLRRDERVNVLLIIVDTLRADHLGCYGYENAQTPTIDALALRGTRFSRVVASAPVTAPSIATIFTSTYPPFHGVRDNEFFALNPTLPTIASVFREAGYRTAAFVGSAVLDKRYGFGEGFDHYDDDMSAEFVIYGESYALEREQVQGAERRAENVTNAAIEWLQKQGGRNPFFCAVHYFDPHLGYNPPPPFRERFRTSPYDGEIAYTDTQIGVLLGALTKMGVRRKTLVVFTADHGEGLGDHGEDSHGYFIYDSTVLVPLVFNLQGNITAGSVIHTQVRTVDIMPTILDLARLDVPETAQGTSLTAVVQGLEEPTNVDDRDAYIETLHTLYSYRWHELQGIRTARWKYVRAPQPEIYDLQADPDEAINLIQKNAEEAERLENTLVDLENELARGSGPFMAKRAKSEPEIVQKMKALGYVGTDTGTRKNLPELGGDYPDPKAMIEELHARHEAKRLLRSAFVTNESGDVDGALELLAQAESLSTNYAEVISLRGFLLSRKGELDEGIRLMEKAVEMSPSSKNLSQMLNNLGVAYFNKQEYEKAVDRLEKALATLTEADAHSLVLNQTLSNLGIAYQRLGDCDNAIDRIKRSLEARHNLRTVLHMCSIYKKCGYPGKAADGLEQVLRDFPNLDSTFVATTRRRVGELRADEAEMRRAQPRNH